MVSAYVSALFWTLNVHGCSVEVLTRLVEHATK